MDARGRATLFLTFAMALTLARPARADTLGVILDAGLPALDPEFKDPAARALVRCTIEHPAAPQTCSQAYAKTKAAGASVGGTKLNTAVEVAKALQAHDWIKVLDLTSTDLAVKIACSAGMPPLGPLKSFLCSSVSAELAKLAKPVLRTALEAVRDQNWPKLIAAVPTLACQIEIIPTAVKATVCTGIDLVLKGGMAAFSAMVNGLANELSSALSWGDRLLGSDVKKQTPKEYFVDWWIPNLHRGAWLRIVEGDAAFSSFVNGRVAACAQYYGTSSPCGPMKTIFVKTVDTAVAALKAAVPLHYEAKVKPDNLYHYTCWLQSKGTWAGFSWGDSSTCMNDLLKQVPIPECDGLQECRPRPTVWAQACKGVQSLLVADLQKQAPAFDQKIADLAKAGCALSPATGGGFNCTRYGGVPACEAALPAHKNLCGLDETKASVALADEILDALGTKRCHHTGTASWELATVECTRPWKADQCKALVAAGVPPRFGTKPICALKLDAAFEPQKARARQVLDVLNSGQAILPTGGGATILGTGTSIRFRPAGCKLALPDPLQIHCTEWDVVQDLAAKVPALNLKSCPPDPKHDGVDEACYQAPLSLAPPGSSIAKAVAAPLPAPPSTRPAAPPAPSPTPARVRK